MNRCCSRRLRCHGTLEQKNAVAFRVRDRILLALVEDDLDPDDDRSFDAFVAEMRERLLAALNARRAQQHWPDIARGLIYSALATALLLGLVGVIGRMRSRLQAKIQYAVERHVLHRRAKSFDWTGSAFQLAHQIVQIMALFMVLALVYFYLICTATFSTCSTNMAFRSCRHTSKSNPTRTWWCRKAAGFRRQRSRLLMWALGQALMPALMQPGTQMHQPGSLPRQHLRARPGMA